MINISCQSVVRTFNHTKQIEIKLILSILRAQFVEQQQSFYTDNIPLLLPHPLYVLYLQHYKMDVTSTKDKLKNIQIYTPYCIFRVLHHYINRFHEKIDGQEILT